jgi:hypothetical protein
MNISGTMIIDQMEQQLSRLRQAIEQGDQATIREYTAVIESHCQLLKSGTKSKMSEPARPVYPNQMMAQATPEQTHIVSSTPVEGEPAPVKEPNLLDF